MAVSAFLGTNSKSLGAIWAPHGKFRGCRLKIVDVLPTLTADVKLRCRWPFQLIDDSLCRRHNWTSANFTVCSPSPIVTKPFVRQIRQFVTRSVGPERFRTPAPCNLVPYPLLFDLLQSKSFGGGVLAVSSPEFIFICFT